ncbi:two-component system protein B [Elsinoe australis]|uniref:histidine kinase n=1 Tax=Elsinoe australis TaxID=40998 RepID=A0A4U7AQX5_9PEZI|nr:two-component system protein B [Elsinoe australis]
MRIPIREQLAALLLLASLVGLGVISIATWFTNYNFVLGVRSTRLSISASLKASQLSSNLALLENSVQFVASRIVVQEALQNYNDNGDNSETNWARAVPDMEAAVGGPASGGAVGRSLLLQSQIRARSDTGPAGNIPVLNTTSNEILGQIKLPYLYPNGTDVYLGDEGIGFPPNLYPNITYGSIRTDAGDEVATANYQDDVISPVRSQALLLGPWQVNSTFSMLSITLPIINNTSSLDVLGWLTVIMDARLITNVIRMRQGLDQTGRMLLIRPANATNQYPPGVLYDANPDPAIFEDQLVQFVLPLSTNASDRHPGRVQGTSNPPFKLSEFPAARQVVTQNQNGSNNAGALMKTKNEAGFAVSTGFAMVDTAYVDWAVIVEQSRGEVWSPINKLRVVLIACVFSTVGAMILISWPLAHFASRPIRELKSATMKSVMPAGYTDSSESLDRSDYEDDASPQGDEADAAIARKEGFFASVLRRRKPTTSNNSDERRRREFRIPGKVPDRKHIVKDELSELTSTFNEMSDELMMQYERLEERVRTRTAELELSKKAAEVANESKTLFIANISHELKTPLNGILGMCAVCMQEDDPIRLKRSLGIIYKSGDLLLNLLTDLLTFSKNQVGQQLSLDEKEFRLRDISSQVLAIFDKQAKDGQIDLSVQFQNAQGEIEGKDTANERPGSRVKDMILWGDTHRILQVIINLVSNSLKFTPPGGKVTLTVKCTGESADIGSRKTSLGSKTSKRNRNRLSDMSALNGRTSGSVEGSAHRERGGAFQRMLDTDRAAPPPGKTFMFEFEVVDTGPGIPEESHQRIFEPFVQGDLGLSKKYGGTGLGLSICSQLAGLMNGAMGIKSEVGVGSTFSMRIPLRHLMSRADSTASSSNSIHADQLSTFSAEGFSTPKRRSMVGDSGSVHSHTGNTGPSSPTPQKDHFDNSNQPRLVGLSQPFFASNQPMESPTSQPAAMEQMTAAASSSGKIRVLVAEDNKVNQEVVLRMLKLEDIYDVTVAKDGQEALDFVKESMSTPSPDEPSSLASKGPFNLIFMDVQMPNLDGLQSTKLIRQTGFDAPIVALTAFAEESNVKDCLDSGMNYFLSKPIRRPALKKVLKEYCAPILEEEEGQISPTDVKNKGKNTSQTTADVKGKSSLSTVASGDDSTRKGSTVDNIDLGMPNSGNTTVVVLSRPNSMEIPPRD